MLMTAMKVLTVPTPLEVSFAAAWMALKEVVLNV